MIHYTFNTNHSRVSPRSEVADEVVAQMSRFATTGKRSLPAPVDDYELVTSIESGLLMATVYRKETPESLRRPCVSFGVARTQHEASSLWHYFERLYFTLTDLPGLRVADFVSPQRPDGLPLLVAITILATPREAEWIADLERCLAWAYLEAHKKAPDQ